MSHAKERTEKNCLNCNAIVAGRFCQVCGQENIEIHETFSHLAGHLISDIFHFDGMFFSTSKYLLFSPGFLTHEYVRGRRASYLNPIKMYVFISAIFFLYFLTVYKSDLKVNVNENKEKSAAVVLRELQNDSSEIAKSLQDKGSPSWLQQRLQTSLRRVNEDISLIRKDSTKKFQVQADRESNSLFTTDEYTSKEEYDSVQKTLPKHLKDNWAKQWFQHKNIDIGNKFRTNKDEMTNALLESFMHHFPQTFFLSLPLFALVLQLLYVRRKQFYYAHHLIYTVHLYCALFVFLFIILVFNRASDIHYLSWLNYVSFAVFLYTMWYTYKALRNYYNQGRVKTFVKWLVLHSAAFFIIIGLFIIMFFFTIATL